MPFMDEKRYREHINQIVDKYQLAYGDQAKKLAELALRYIQEGVQVDIAVKRALNEMNFFGVNREVITQAVYEAACAGFGILPSVTIKPHSIKTHLLTESWASDKMNLSARLYGASEEMRQTIIDTISTSMRQSKSWVQMARDLYNGYGAGNKIPTAELPDYMEKLVRQARRVMAGDITVIKEYERAINNAQRKISNLSSRGAPTKALKAAYTELLQATERFSDKAIDRAVRVAIEEKARYHAERIARTEISAAWGDGFLARYRDDPNVIAFRWRLNPRHPKFDICDLHAMADFYGLGPGVYPKDKYPKRPAHPHCNCPIEAIYVGELHDDLEYERQMVEKAKFNPKAGNTFLKGLSPELQLQLLGSEGLKAWQRGDNWQYHLRLWNGVDDPKSRLKTHDFVTAPGSKMAGSTEKWYNESEAYYRKIIEHEPRITTDVMGIVVNAGGKMEGLEFRVKTKDSFLRKVESDYQLARLDNDRITQFQVANSINDVIRYTAIADENAFYPMYLEVMQQLKANDYILVKMKNTWNDDFNPYKGVNVILKSPNGQKFELQFHTPDSFNMKQRILHELYEKFRLDTTSAAEKEQLRRIMLELSKELKRPKGIEKIT